MSAFAQVPAHVGAGLLRREHVHFFVGVLTDVPNPEIVVGRVEGEAIWIAQAVKPDFAARVLPHERIGRGNGIVEAGRVWRINVNAQHFSQEHVYILAVA